MKNGKDFRKINNGIYGAINFNNMIPVLDSALIEIDIENIADVKTAINLRNLIFADESKLNEYEKIVKQRCCNLIVLEEKYKEWK